jgi:glutamyl-tRNA(Gln) amidotransferase subunit D
MTTKPEELMYLVPELSEIAEIKINNLMGVSSEDMTYREWEQIADAVADALNKGSRGVVILHGTDIMHYTSAALSFMLQGINAPVVLTGAQRSTDRGSSDGFMDLACATRIAAESDIAEVGICMHASTSDDFCTFTRGTKVRKMHTSRRDAFKPINNRSIARVSAEGAIEYLSDYRKMSTAKGKVHSLSKFEPKVALLKFYPNSDPEIVDHYVEKGYKGIIIEGTGLGHVAVAPKEEKYSWPKHIEKAVSAGLVIGVTSQCLNGRVNKNVYRNLRLISKAGAIYCEDMMPEVALVKLGFLLGNHGREKAAELLDKDMAGEITKRTEVDWYL